MAVKSGAVRRCYDNAYRGRNARCLIRITGRERVRDETREFTRDLVNFIQLSRETAMAHKDPQEGGGKANQTIGCSDASALSRGIDIHGRTDTRI